MSYVDVTPQWEGYDPAEMELSGDIALLLSLVVYNPGLLPVLLETSTLWLAGFDVNLVIPQEYIDVHQTVERAVIDGICAFYDDANSAESY